MELWSRKEIYANKYAYQLGMLSKRDTFCSYDNIGAVGAMEIWRGSVLVGERIWTWLKVNIGTQPKGSMSIISNKKIKGKD
jgi:hypothetical protein